MSRRLRVLLAGAVMTSLMLVMASTAWATTFTVTNTSDFGKGSLREAMEAANSNPGADEIEFAEGVSGTITLASTLPTVTDPEGLTIDGGGDVTVSGNNRVRVLQEANGAKLALKNLTIAGGYSGDLTDGGGIYNGGGTLTVTNSTFSGNTASQFGGSVYNRGELEVPTPPSRATVP
jgi:hypothetical protein